jgi:hypothetical protein
MSVCLATFIDKPARPILLLRSRIRPPYLAYATKPARLAANHFPKNLGRDIQQKTTIALLIGIVVLT